MWIFLDFASRGWLDGRRPDKKPPGGVLGTPKGAKTRTKAVFECLCWALLGPNVGPKPPRPVSNWKANLSLIVFLAPGGGKGRLGEPRTTDRKLEPNKEPLYSQRCGCPWAVLGIPAGYARPHTVVWGGKLPRNGIIGLSTATLMGRWPGEVCNIESVHKNAASRKAASNIFFEGARLEANRAILGNTARGAGALCSFHPSPNGDLAGK